MNFIAPVTEIIKVRQSKRSFSNELLSEVQLERIRTILEQNSVGPFENVILFKLIEKASAQANYKVKLGTYGFISGAHYFIAAGVDTKNPYVFEDYGFLLEKIILHLTDLGLGTCWLGGTFKRDEFASVFDDSKQIVIPAITPLGNPNRKNSLKDNLIRWGAKSNSRKAWSELFYNDAFENQLTETEAGEYQIPIEMVRLAPSASNKQPWRIVKQGGVFHFYLLETPGYSDMVKSVKLQKIDMGIAMAHFQLTCNEQNLPGKWQVHEPVIDNSDSEYLISWVVS